VLLFSFDDIIIAHYRKKSIGFLKNFKKIFTLTLWSIKVC